MDSIYYDYNSTEFLAGGNTTFSEIIHFLECIQFYYTPFLVASGSIGNWLSVIVFFSTKLRKLSSSYYLAALAISDTGFLLAHFMTWLNMIEIHYFNTPIICEVSIYISNVCSFLSVYFIVAFTVERFIAVRYPLKRPSMCTVSRAKIVLSSLTLFALISYTPTFIIAGVEERVLGNRTVPYCDVREGYKDLSHIINSIDAFVVLIIPFSAICVINICICYTVWKLARIRRTMTNSASSTTRTVNGIHRPTIRTAAASCMRNQSSQTKVTKMLLVVSTVFLILNLPSYIFRARSYFVEKNEEKAELLMIVQHSSYILFQTNFAINFILYCISGQNFRKALASLCCPKRPRGNETTRVTVVSEFGRSMSARRRTITLNGSLREAHEMLPLTQ